MRWQPRDPKVGYGHGSGRAKWRDPGVRHTAGKQQILDAMDYATHPESPSVMR